MKKLITILAVIMVSTISMAQNIQETTVQVGQITVPAFTVSIAQDEDRASSLMKKQFKEWGVSTTRSNGYVMSIAEVISDLSAAPINFYSKIEETGRRDNKATVITVAAVSSNLSVEQSTLNASVRQFLTSFVQRVAQDEANEKSAEIQKKLDKATKVAAAAAATIATIDKDIAKRQGKIDSKKKDMEKLQAKMDKLQKEITEDEAEIQKYNTKKEEYTKKATAANQDVEAISAELEKYKSIAY